MHGLPKTAEGGDVYYTYKIEGSEANMTFYFNDCDTCPRICKQILVSTPYVQKAFFVQKFKAKYKSAGMNKWANIDENIHIEFDEDFYKMDLLFITIKPINP